MMLVAVAMKLNGVDDLIALPYAVRLQRDDERAVPLFTPMACFAPT
jgi:hypothetical protein